MAYTERALARMNLPLPVGDTAGAVKSATAAMYFYVTDDAAAVVEAAGYFNSARNRLTKGCVIIASMVNAGTPVAKTYIATAVPATGNVTIVLLATTAG